MDEKPTNISEDKKRRFPLGKIVLGAILILLGLSSIFNFPPWKYFGEGSEHIWEIILIVIGIYFIVKAFRKK